MRLSIFTLFTFLFCFPSPPFTFVVRAGRVQSTGAAANPSRAAAVKNVFQSSFNDYLRYARGADELTPLSKHGGDGFGNWGATFIDALTTAHLMGLDDIVRQGTTFAEQVDFASTNASEISLFETNIRYVTSLVSLYELTGSSNGKLIEQAQVIADRLLHGWVGANAIPFNGLQAWTAGPTAKQSDNAIIAEAGTLLLEFDRLSKFSKNATYKNFAVMSMKAIINSKAVLPGLYGQGIDPRTNAPTDDYATWSGGSDSFFEYLLKYGQLIGSTDVYIPTWINSVKSSIQYLLTKPAGTSANLTHMADYSPKNGGKIPRFSHLGCFVGGNWILGGKLLGSDEIVQYGLDLTSSCVQTYTKSLTGIGPETYVFKTESGSTNGVTIHDEEFYNQNGFDYDVPSYSLRPEVLESVFYAYRATGDVHWQDVAWDAFNNIVKYCKAPAALAAINSVNTTRPSQVDSSPSFLYAELLKYLFLIFDEPDKISLDEYVFNTEAHPYKVDDPSAEYAGVPVGTLPEPFQSSAMPPTQTSPRRQVPLPRITGLAGLLKQIAFVLRR